MTFGATAVVFVSGGLGGVVAALALRRVGQMGRWSPWTELVAGAFAVLLVGTRPLGVHPDRVGVVVVVAAQCLAMAVLAGGLAALSAVDLDRGLLPVRIVYPTLAGVAGCFTLSAVAGGGWWPLGRAALGGLAAGALFFVVHLLRPEGMGFGDVRLALLVGVALGWSGANVLVTGLLLGLTGGALAGMAGMATGRLGRNDPLPFGPFLAAGTVAALCLSRLL